MRIKRVMFFSFIISIYLFLFQSQENQVSQTRERLTKPLPYSVQKIIFGYLSQFQAGLLYGKTNVFLGNVTSAKVFEQNYIALADTFTVISKLHPKLKDTYFFTQGYLPSINRASARSANLILAIGAEYYKNDWTFDFFRAFNHFFYLGEPVEAAKTLMTVTREHENVPGWLKHFASVLAVRGGNIQTGLFWLETMLQTEQDEKVKDRYLKSIDMYKRALQVSQAIEIYQKSKGYLPGELDDLVPDFISGLPDFKTHFVLKWDPPVLKMVRPERKAESEVIFPELK